MSIESQYENNHLVYIKSGVATKEQVHCAIRTALIDAAAKLKCDFECKFRINVVGDRIGKKFGFTYVWFTDPKVYNMIIGLNPDGSERMEYEDDLDWTPSTQDQIRSLQQKCKQTKNWADMIEYEEELDKIQTRPQVGVPLEPLIQLPPYEIFPHQTEEMRQLLLGFFKPEYAKHAPKGFLTHNSEDLIEIMQWGYFEVKPATVSTVESHLSSNILCGLGVPNWVNESDIKNAFRPYIYDKETKVRRKINGSLSDETYPLVNIPRRSKLMVFLTFEQTLDAQYALLMMRKWEFTKKTSEGEKKCTIVFNHAFNNHTN